MAMMVVGWMVGPLPAAAFVGWEGGEPPVGAPAQPPAALMHGPMMGPAQQGQIRQVGRAAMEPVAQMMGLTPAQGALAAREDTAAVPHGQGGALGRTHDPGGPADLQGLGRGPTQEGGSTARACWSRLAS
jgi:hypothetical protein